MRWTLALGLALAAPLAAAAESEAPAPAIEITARYAPSQAPTLSSDERARLAHGEVVVREMQASDSDGIGMLVMAVVDAPPERVWQVMADCDAYEEFVPRVSHARVRDRDGAFHTCELVVDLPMPLGDQITETRQQTRRLPDGAYQRLWTLLPGDWSYHRNDGSWTAHPHGEGAQSLLVNRMDARPKSSVPLWILRAAQVRQAPETFLAIRKRVVETADPTD